MKLKTGRGSVWPRQPVAERPPTPHEPRDDKARERQRMSNVTTPPRVVHQIEGVENVQ